MPTFFTVDRLGRLSPGARVEPNLDLSGHRICTVAGQYDETVMREAVQVLYPTGITEHGKRYLFDESLIYPPGSGSQQMVPLSPMIEIIFELVRRYEFPTRPSRMVSVFGFSTLQDAQQFRAKFGVLNAGIFEVECNSSFRADMRLLILGGSTLGSWIHARRYWQGQASADPLWEELLTTPVVVRDRIE